MLPSCCPRIKGYVLNFFFADIAVDWSDHALWWPSRNKWLTRTRSTLDQYGVQADAVLHFTPMHKTLRLQLPDLRYLDCKVDFSIKTFNAVMQLCKELGNDSLISFKHIMRGAPLLSDPMLEMVNSKAWGAIFRESIGSCALSYTLGTN